MIQALITNFAASCSDGGSFFGLPHWYEYLDGRIVGGKCTPIFTGLNDVWLVVAAVIEIMLRIAAIIAVFVIIYGGFEYITSQGEPDKTTKARMSIINAAIGLAISVFASVLVAFIARSIN